MNVDDLNIYDLQGNIVRTLKVGRAFDHVLLDLSALAAGAYLYQVGNQPAQQLVKL